MVSRSAVVCLVVIAAVSATDVSQCPGKSLDDLSSKVQLSPCKKLPCKLKKGTSQGITIKFTPDTDLDAVKNSVKAEVFGVPLPFIGVDGNSVCDKVFLEDGTKALCPLKAGESYLYKDAFPILSLYPNIQAKVHWALTANDKDIVCFEVPVRIL